MTRYRVSILDDKKVLELGSCDGCSIFLMCLIGTKLHTFKW